MMCVVFVASSFPYMLSLQGCTPEFRRQAEQLNEQIWQRLDALAPMDRKRSRCRQSKLSGLQSVRL